MATSNPMKRFLLSLCAAVLVAACQSPSNNGRLVGSEQVIAVSPMPDSIYLYTPGSVEGFEQTLGTLNMNLTRMAVSGHSRVKPFFEAMGLDATELAQKPITHALEEITRSIEGMDKRTSANLLRGMGFDAASI